MSNSIKKISRNKSHELIMQCLYDITIKGKFEKYIFKKIYKTEKIDDFSQKIVLFILENKENIIKKLEKKLINWKWSRISTLSQVILIMSYAHYNIEKIDKAIIINIAVKLSKNFLDNDEYKFVNAVLDKILV
ncbi:MAG: transcription antitermination protein NusB [Bacilli bacterium]|nr:transcription antitermination protein NusB [Bacilli bacterium]